MTAALGYLHTLSTQRRRSGQLLSIAAVLFSVPTFAAVGLSLPLPVTVERIAANLVPFANASAVETQGTSAPKSHGKIVLAPAERRAEARPTRAHESAPARPVPGRAVTRRAVAPATPAANAPAPRHDPVDAATQTTSGTTTTSGGGNGNGGSNPNAGGGNPNAGGANAGGNGGGNGGGGGSGRGANGPGGGGPERGGGAGA